MSKIFTYSFVLPIQNTDEAKKKLGDTLYGGEDPNHNWGQGS